MISKTIMIILNIVLIVFSIYTGFNIIKNKCNMGFVLFSMIILILAIYNCVFSTFSIMFRDVIIHIMTSFVENGMYTYEMEALQIYNMSYSYILFLMMIYVIYRLFKMLKLHIIEIKNRRDK